MIGVGKSLRERAEMTFLDCCKEVMSDVSHIGNWVDWDALVDAGKELVGLALVVIMLALFPITIPFAGYVRMKAARKRFQMELAREERVAKLQSRVQKV